MAVGVVYNNARIAFATRARELGTLRILGFTWGEVASLLMVEQGIQVGCGIPVGLWLGRVFARAIVSTTDPETWRFPLVISIRTYTWSALAVAVAAALSAGWMVVRVRRLDLVEVQKGRE
jgi:putative ABC transport system permease protein